MAAIRNVRGELKHVDVRAVGKKREWCLQSGVKPVPSGPARQTRELPLSEAGNIEALPLSSALQIVAKDGRPELRKRRIPSGHIVDAIAHEFAHAMRCPTRHTGSNDRKP